MSALDLKAILDRAHDCEHWKDEEDVPRLVADVRALVGEVERLREAIDHPILRKVFGDIEDSGTKEASGYWHDLIMWFPARDEAMRAEVEQLRAKTQ